MSNKTKPSERDIVADNMILRGVAFVKALGHALSRADNENKNKIRETWPELWDKYLKM